MHFYVVVPPLFSSYVFNFRLGDVVAAPLLQWPSTHIFPSPRLICLSWSHLICSLKFFCVIICARGFSSRVSQSCHTPSSSLARSSSRWTEIVSSSTFVSVDVLQLLFPPSGLRA